MTNPNFTFIKNNPFVLTDVGSYNMPTFVDIDKDGDMDAFVGSSNNYLNYYENIGNASSPNFASPVINPFGIENIQSYSVPTFVDIDKDGDMDAFVGTTLTLKYYQNTGSVTNPNFASPINNPFGLTQFPNYTAHAFVDIDKDGDMDSFVGTSSGNIYYLQNIGSVSSPNFAPSQTNPFGFTNVGSNAAPTFVDIDKDGDMDAFVNSNISNPSKIYYFENTGSASNPIFATAQINTGLSSSGGYDLKPTFVDIDQDGNMDAFTGLESGDISYFKLTPPPNSNPTNISLNPSSINENVAGGSIVGTFTSTDPDTGNTFTYSLVAPSTGTNDNSAFIIDATTGQLRINSSPDFETKSSYSIRVRTTDQGRLFFEKDLTISINDVTELTPNSDLWQGTTTADIAEALSGNDRLYGNGGNDTLDGGDGDDLLYGGNDNDLLRGGNGLDRLYGDVGNDNIMGEAGDDLIYGGIGNDTLTGGAGSDRLYGDAGNDTFVLQTGMGQDTIYQFVSGTDKIQIKGVSDYAGLKLVPSGTNTLIKVLETGETLGIVSSVIPSQNDFVFDAQLG